MLWKRSLQFCKYNWLRLRQSSSRTSVDPRGASHMVWSTDVLTTVSSDTEPSFLLTLDTKYAFNAGENSGRAWGQRGMGRRGFKMVFLTSIGTQRGAGLPGLTMFLADSGIQNLTIVGPHGLHHYLASMRTFLWRDNMSVKPIEIETTPCRQHTQEPRPVYKDMNLTVYGIHLSPVPVEDNTSMDQEQPENPGLKSFNKRKRSQSPPSPSKRPHVDPSSGTASTSQVKTPRELEDAETYMSPSLYKAFSTWGFSPSYLVGDDAKEWLKLTIENMFPKPPPAPQPKFKRSKKPVKVEETETPKATYGDAKYHKLLWHKNRRLPKFVPELSNSSDPAMKQTMCYIAIGPRYRGKFDVEKANALGLKKGRDRARVCAGQTVTYTTDDGVERTVSPEDVVGSSEAPKVVIILDVPSPAHILDLTTAFETNPVYNKIRSKRPEDREEYSTYVVYHTLGARVLEDPRYKEFMNGFDDSVHHIVGSKEHSPDPVTFTSVGGLQLKLNNLDKDMFPIPYHRLEPERELSSVLGLPPNLHLMKNSLTADCRPVKPPRPIDGWRDDFHPFVTGKEDLRYSRQMEAAIRRSRSRSRSISPSPLNRRAVPKPREPGDDVVVVPLGTSSAIPSRYRNVSSTLIRIPDYGSVLLDCGEGTWGQLIRLYGDDPEHKSGVWEVLRDIKCIYLSHVHGDHHIGLSKILSMRSQMKVPPTSPVWVVGLHQHLLYMQEVNDLEDLGLDNSDGNGVISVLSDALSWQPPRPYPGGVQVEKQDWLDHNRSRALAKDMCTSLGLTEFTTVFVDHKTRCYGSVMKHQDGWSIVFSADTKPTTPLVEAGKGATLLIHEATMGDDEKESAKQKAHSTFGQAVDIGKRMEAKKILLTHFSSRYPKMPTPSMSDETTWAVAMDHAIVPIGDIPKLRAYIPAIQRCFQEAPEDDEEEEQLHKGDVWAN